MKKVLALVVAAVFAIGSGLVEAAPKKAASGHGVSGKAAAKGKKAHLAKTHKHKKAVVVKHGKAGKKTTRKAVAHKAHH